MAAAAVAAATAPLVEGRAPAVGATNAHTRRTERDATLTTLTARRETQLEAAFALGRAETMDDAFRVQIE